MATKLQLKEVQQLTITPVMHYFIELLTTGRYELTERIKDEVDSNPMLEIDSEETQAGSETDENDYEKRLERADSSFITSYEDHGFFKKSQGPIDKNRAIETMTPTPVNLAEYLMKQANAMFDNKREIEIARQIIYNLDSSGYLKVEMGSIAHLLETTPEEIERIRTLIMTFDPTGCGSQSVKECLLVQLSENQENEKLRQLIQNHLEDLSRSRYEHIQKTMGISIEELFTLISHLKRLTPRPAEKIEKDEPEYAEVDLMLLKENNEYKVVYVDEGLPRLTLSRYYQEMFEKTKEKKATSFLKSRYRDAQFFIESIDLRKKTIVKIAEYLVKVQKDFIDFGEKWKKPLTMKEVARAVNLNESTISRSTNNKFIATEKGLISLKNFFSYGLKGEFGFTHSVGNIREKIKELVSAEPRENPITDEEITLKLAELGIRIARRTVRNYREEMGIPSSFIRKKENQIKGAKS